MWKEAVVAYLTHRGSIFMDELSRITKNYRTADLGLIFEVETSRLRRRSTNHRTGSLG